MNIESGLKLAKSEGGPALASSEQAAVRRFWRQAVIFVLVGLGLYLCLYGVSEALVYKYGLRNRFYGVRTAPLERYDDVIVGASRAAVFDYEDMNAQLEGMTGHKVLNLSVVGAGPVVNRLLLEYFLMRHETPHVLYVVDSFAFYSAEWNEERLGDAKLYYRAPLDLDLARLLVQHRAPTSVVAAYVTGFAKINNQERFAADVTDDETLRFERTYRPVAQLDRQRLAYLYPGEVDAEVLGRYLAEFEETLELLEGRGIEVTVMKPPIPERIYAALPNEEAFDAALGEVLARHNNVEYYDYSLVNNDEAFFFNADHLNREGVMRFFEGYLGGLLRGGE